MIRSGLWTAVCLGVSLLAQPAVAQELEPDAAARAQAMLEQDTVPGWLAREAAAQARAEALAGWLAGERALAAALPDLSDGAWNDPAVLAARLSALDQATVARLQEASAAASLPPTAVSALQAAHRAETAQVAVEREAVLRLLAVVTASPGLQHTAVQAALDRVDAAAAALAEAPQGDVAASAAQLALDEERARWGSLQRGLAELASGREASRSAEAELRQMAQPATSVADLAPAWRAIERWAAGQQVWTEESRAVGVEVESYWRQTVEAPVLQAGAAAADPDTAEEALAWLDVGDAVAAAVAGAGGPVPDELLALRAEASSLRAAWRQGLQQARATAAAEEAARLAGVERAAAKAEDAQARSEQDGAHPSAALEAASRAWTAEVLARDELWREELQAARTTRVALLDTVQAEVQSLARGAAAGSIDVDASYEALRDLVEALRDEVAKSQGEAGRRLNDVAPLTPTDQRRALLQGMAAAARDLEPAAGEAAMSSIEAARSAIAAEPRALSALDATAKESFEQHLDDLRRAKGLRQALRARVSSAQLGLDDDRFGRDVARESALLVPQLDALVKTRLRLITRLPSQLMDPGWVQRTTWGMFGIILVLLTWRYLRRITPTYARDALRRLARAGVLGLRPAAREGLVKPLGEVLRYATDTAGFTVVGMAVTRLVWVAFDERLPEVDLAFEALALTATLRLGFAVLDLFLADSGQPRPALVVLSPDGHKAVRRAMTLVVWWWVAGWVLERLLLDVVVAGSIARVVHWVAVALGVGLVAMILWRLEPRLRARISRLRTPVPWVDRLAAQPGTLPLPPVRALVFGGMAVAAVVWEVANGRVASALGPMVDRARFGRDAGQVGDYLSRAERKQIAAHPVPADDRADGPVATVRGHLAAWKKDPRQGLVVLTADRGQAVSQRLDQLEQCVVGEEEMPVLRLKLGARRTTPQAALAWLRDALEVERTVEAIDLVVRAVEQRPASVIVIEDLERAFVRKVGGLAALRTLLYVANATGDHHLWVMACHRPAWRYLARLGSLLNTGVVRAVVDVPGQSASQIRAMAMAAAAAQGLDPGFARLEGRGLFRAAPDIEREQTLNGFFRLLTEASGGNPQVAMEIWARCVRRTSDGQTVVAIDPCMVGTAVGALSTPERFVLAAVRLHGRIRVPELSRALDEPVDEVRAVVRELEQQGALGRRGAELEIPLAVLHAVTADLQRVSLLGKEA